jgi:hypothetical protein
MYWLSQNILPIEESIRRVDQQYTVKQNVSHILKSLVYFEDAENDPDPETNFKASWKEVKAFFTNQIPRVTRDLVNLN